MEDKIAIGKRIKERIVVLDIDKGVLAEKLEVSEDAINKWCRGVSSPRRDKVKPLADILEVSPNYILTGKKQLEEITPDSEIEKELERYKGYMKTFDTLVKSLESQIARQEKTIADLQAENARLKKLENQTAANQ